MDMLLASSSRCHPWDDLAHLHDAVSAWADGVEEVLFVPWARVDHASYTMRVRAALAPTGLTVRGADEVHDPLAAVADAAAVFVGGGNTFLLLDTMQRTGMLDVLRDRVQAGQVRYLGTSAGSNLACPTIQTTNDMPVVWPVQGPTAMGLVRVQLNVHWVDPDPGSTHQGETRTERIAEFHQHHDRPVIGLREHAWIRVRGAAAHVEGAPSEIAPGVLLTRGAAPLDLPAGTDVGEPVLGDAR